jgi:chromate transporter
VGRASCQHAGRARGGDPGGRCQRRPSGGSGQPDRAGRSGSRTERGLVLTGRSGTASGPSLATILREWGRIGCVGFGGPPAHIALFRDLCVARNGWLSAEQFEDAIAATNLLPGPGSTQLSIFCAWRLRGLAGALVGGAGFILPGLVAIIGLAAVFLASAPPQWVLGAGAGAGAAVAAVAVRAGLGLVPASWLRARDSHRRRWALYVLAGLISAALLGAWLVLVLIACGLLELAIRRPGAARTVAGGWALPWRLTGLYGKKGAMPALGLAATGGIGALAWTAFKVGALSYGGGFVIVPLMQADAVSHYHWMSNGQFLNAVALGQVTPGPVVHTVAVVGYAAAGVWGALLAAAVAFAPSFSFVLLGAERFDRLRADLRARAFLDGAGPAAIGAILGSAIPLALALGEAWQVAVLAAAAIALLVARRGVVPTLLAAGLAGVAIALAGGPLPA